MALGLERTMCKYIVPDTRQPGDNVPLRAIIGVLSLKCSSLG